MAGKVGKALGFSMDHSDNSYMSKRGINDEDVDATTGIGSVLGKTPARDQVPAEGDSDSDMGEDGAPDSMGEDMKSPTAEVMAMKLFDKAGSPEAKVDAFRALLEACGVTSGY